MNFEQEIREIIEYYAAQRNPKGAGKYNCHAP